jgi:type II secretory pathway pseudopilin PulG
MEGCMQTGRPSLKRRRRTAPQRVRAAGFTYLGLLWLLAAAAAGLAVVGQSWTLAAQRERERELIFRGEQIRDAIDRYRKAIPTDSSWPESMDALLQDRRDGEPRHHLRRRFEDPFGPAAGWGEIRNAAGGLIGVHSRATVQALGAWKRDPAGPRASRRVSDWRFLAAEAVESGTADGAAPAADVPR